MYRMQGSNLRIQFRVSLVDKVISRDTLQVGFGGMLCGVIEKDLRQFEAGIVLVLNKTRVW